MSAGGLELGTLSGRLSIDETPLKRGLSSAIDALRQFSRDAASAGTDAGKGVGTGLAQGVEGSRGKLAAAGKQAAKSVGDGAEPAAKAAGKRSADAYEGGFNVKGLVGRLGAGLAALGVGAAAVGAAKFGLDVAAQNETASISFETMLGSAEKAKTFLGDLQQFAAKTPFEFSELQTAAGSLTSIGVDANKVIPIMTTLGNVTSGMGTGSEGVKRATVAIQQMNAAGKITAEDLNQLRDAGIPVYDLLAAAMGKSKEEVAELASNGKLGKDALDAMMKALETGSGLERFSGLMDKQSASLSGMVSTIKDELGQGLASAIEPHLPAIKAALGEISTGLGDFFANVKGFKEWVSANIEWLAPLTAGIVAMGLAWGGYMLITQGIPAALTAVKLAMLAVNATMAANPIGIVVALIAGLVAAFIVAYNTSEDFRNIVDGALRWVQETAGAVGAWFAGPFVDFFRNAAAWVGAQFDGIGQWFGRVGDDLMAAGRRVGDFFTIDVPAAFGRAAELVGGAFSGVKDLLLAPIRGAVDWINKTFVSGINGFLGVLGITWRVPEIPGFSEGGYTGPGGRNQPAGVVHAGEVVWSQDDVAAWGGPQSVDGMRRARGVTPSDFLPGFAGGGIVPNATQGFAGYYAPALSAMQAWAAASGRTWSMTGIGGARTYAQQWAAYQNYLAGGNLAADPRRGLGPHMVPAIAMDLSPRPGDIPAARALLGNFGLGLPVPGEPWHVQYLAGRGGGGTTTGGPIDFGIGALLSGLLDKIPGLADPWGDVVTTILGKVPSALIGKVGDLLGFDNGGWLMPGVTTAVNATGRPEAILTGDQWDSVADNRLHPDDITALAAAITSGMAGAQLEAVGMASAAADVIGTRIVLRSSQGGTSWR